MGGFSSSIASSGSGGAGSPMDPSQFLGGQSPDGAQPGQSPQAPGPSPDFVQTIGRMGMQIEQQLDSLSGQFPEAADDIRTAKMALKKGMAKILTTNPQASGGPMAPRTA